MRDNVNYNAFRNASKNGLRAMLSLLKTSAHLQIATSAQGAALCNKCGNPLQRSVVGNLDRSLSRNEKLGAPGAKKATDPHAN